MTNKQSESNQAELWTPASQMGVSLFKASFTTFVYSRHTHDEYALGVIEQGVQRFTHKGVSHYAPPMSIITVNPDEVHDGEAHTAEGYRYRMLYLGLPFLRVLLGDQCDRNGLLAFKGPITSDPQIARRLSWALQLFETKPELIDELLPPILDDLFSRHATPQPLHLPVADNTAAVRRAVDYIRAHVCEEISLDLLAGEVGLSKYHFLRQFKRVIGLTPHAFHLHRRVELARQALEQGSSPADAAALAGFADQSHLTRRFKTVYGLTPGVLAKSY